MATEDAFNKRLSSETTMDKVEGLLEHFNLPPKVIDFIRGNQRIIQVFIAIVIVTVVAWSLYGSYRDRIKEEGASALSIAMEKTDGQADALREVTEKYGSTSSAIWASIELAHIDMKNGAFNDASKKYAEVISKVKNTNPLYPLVIYGLAQSLEGDKKYQEASKQYDLLKEIKGYTYLSHIALGRLEEAQGNFDKAIAIYNNFLLSAGEDKSLEQEKMAIDAKIGRLKTQK